MGHTDQHGNPISGSAEGIERFDLAVDRLLRFHPDVVDLAGSLSTEDAGVPMGRVLLAYLHLMSTDPQDVEVARGMVAELDRVATNERERAHTSAISAWAHGRWSEAAGVLDELLVRWPADLLALAVGHQLDFFTGDAANLRDRVARSLHAIDPGHPHRGFADGMFAFGLEESGHYGHAESAGLTAVEANPDDVWAVHAVVHTYEMTGRIDEGIRFMQSRTDDWGSGNLFTVHNWWHLCLYLLEAGSPEWALAVYDEHIHHRASAPVALELLDASALLWRLRLDGVDVGERFVELAAAWDEWDTGVAWYAFNDLHAVIALCGAGRLDDARARIARLERYAGDGGPSSNLEMTTGVGLPACRAALAFTEERYDDAIAELAPVRRRAHRFGGSHAQRDLLARTLTDAAVRAPRIDLARALLEERLATRDTSVYGLTRLGEVLRRSDRPEEAELVLADADAQRRRFQRALAPMPV